MTTSNSLNVWFKNNLVGILWHNNIGKIGFRYEESWVSTGFPISQQLPLKNEEYSPDSGKAHQFFVNLLPEAEARNHIVRDLKIANSDFGLLKAIGGECAGALSILPEEFKPDNNTSYKTLSDDELRKIILRKGMIYNLSSNNKRPRLSLAGAQDKCAIFVDEDKHYLLPEGAAPSTHILKFEITGYRNIPVYEYFTNKLANSIGLPVVDIQLEKSDKQYYLLIKRYDRILNNPSQVVRLHQEDFCQALGIGYAKKYQQEGGPSFPDCYKMIQKISTSAIKDAENLLRWQIFNILAGNSDAHAKNLAILYQENRRPELAPFYDLVCTRAIERIDKKLAMSIGTEYDPDKITQEDWEDMANACNIRMPFIKKMIQEISAMLLEKFSPTYESFVDNFGSYPALQCIQKVITKQCKKSLKLFL